jgi:hypothetical protein
VSGKSVAKTVLVHLASSEIVLLPVLILVLVGLYALGLPGIEIVLFGSIGVTLGAILLALVRFLRKRSAANG